MRAFAPRATKETQIIKKFLYLNIGRVLGKKVEDKKWRNIFRINCFAVHFNLLSLVQLCCIFPISPIFQVVQEKRCFYNACKLFISFFKAEDVHINHVL